MATATVEFNVNIKKIFEYLKQNISTKNSEAVRDIEKIQDYIKKTTDEYVLEIMNDKNEAHMFMMFMEYALNCTEDKKKIDNLSNDVEYIKLKECYRKMYEKMTETNKDFNQVYSYLHSVLEKPSGLVNSSGKAKVSKTQLKAVLHSHEVGDFDFSNAPNSATRGDTSRVTSSAPGFAQRGDTSRVPSSARGFGATSSAPGFAAPSSAPRGPPGLAPGFAAPRDTTLGATSSAHVYNTDQYGNFMPLGWTYQKINNLDTYTFKYDGEEEIIQYISPNGDNIYYKPGTNQEFIRKDLNKRGVYTEIPANRQIKTNGKTKGNTKGHKTTIMGQQIMGQSIGQPMSGQTMSGQTMSGQPMMGQPMMGNPMMGNPMMGQPMIGNPMMGNPIMGQSMGQPKLKKGKNSQGYQQNPQGFQPNPQGFQPNPQGFQLNPQGFQLNPQGVQPNPHFSQPKLQGFQTQQPGLPQQSGFLQQQMSIPTQYTPSQQLQTFVGKKIKYSNGKVGGDIIFSYPNGTFILDTLNQQTGENKTVHINSFPKIWTLA